MLVEPVYLTLLPLRVTNPLPAWVTPPVPLKPPEIVVLPLPG